MSRTRLWRGNGQPELPEVGSRAERHVRHRRSPGLKHSRSSSPKNLAETSNPPPLPLSHDGRAMIPRTLSSTTKRRVNLTPPVRKRDASGSPAVGVKARTVLPRLPVPPLRSTLDKYLQSIKPLLLQDDLRGVSAFNSAYQQRVDWTKEFETGIGETLQARLVGIHCCLFALAVPVLSI